MTYKPEILVRPAKAMYIVDYPIKLLGDIKKAKLVALDTETISLEDRTMVGFSVAYEGIVFYVPVADKFLKNMTVTKAQYLLYFILKECRVVFHNSSFDIPVIKNFGVGIPEDLIIEDTVIMANLIDENVRHGLKALTKQYFNYQMTELKEVCGTGKKRIGFHEVEDESKVKYACDDARYTLKLYHKLSEQLCKDVAVTKIYTDIEQPLLNAVAQMHINGVRIDVQQVMEISNICKKKIDVSEAKLKILMGKDINFGSSKQLREYFIDKCHMPVLKQSSKTGAASVDKEVLELYAETNSEAKLLLEFRKYSKIHSTFIPALTPKKWDSETMTGFIHASFNQAGTVSGRFSSSRPNMQNIPRDDKEFNIRATIIPEKNHILIGADYSQIELRVLAHFSQDTNLLIAYNNNKDIHQQTADALGIDRYPAKTINFGIVYGMGCRTLGKQVKVTPEEAQRFIDKYFETYPGVKTFWKEAEDNFRIQGYVETLSGRKRRRSQHFFSKDDYEQGAEVRSAINSIIQGTAADLIKASMVDMHRRLKPFGAKLILTVHDEVLVSCPMKYAKACQDIVKSSMMKAGECLSVPVGVDIKFGRTWAEAHGDGIKLKDVRGY